MTNPRLKNLRDPDSSPNLIEMDQYKSWNEEKELNPNWHNDVDALLESACDPNNRRKNPQFSLD